MNAESSTYSGNDDVADDSSFEHDSSEDMSFENMQDCAGTDSFSADDTSMHAASGDIGRGEEHYEPTILGVEPGFDLAEEAPTGTGRAYGTQEASLSASEGDLGSDATYDGDDGLMGAAASFSSEEAGIKPASDPDALSNLLGDWALLSRAQKAAFISAVAEIDNISSLMESSTQDLSDNFTAVVNASKSQITFINEILHAASLISGTEAQNSLPNIIKYLDETLSDGIAKVVSLSKECVRMIFELEEIITYVDQTERIITNINDINRQTNLLALNAKIEATRAGDAGKGFGVVSDEMKELSHAINQLAEDIKEKLGLVDRGIRSGFAALKSIANVDMTENIVAKDRIDILMRDLMDYNNEFQSKLSQSALMSEKINSQVSGLITGFQFQDRATQYLGALSDILDYFADMHEDKVLEAKLVLRTSIDRAGDNPYAEHLIEHIRLDEIRRKFRGGFEQAGILESTGAATKVHDDDDDIELF